MHRIALPSRVAVVSSLAALVALAGAACGGSDPTPLAPVDASADVTTAPDASPDASEAAAPRDATPGADAPDATESAPDAADAADAPDAGPPLGASCDHPFDLTPSLPNGAPVRIGAPGPAQSNAGAGCRAPRASTTYLRFHASEAGNYEVTVFGGDTAHEAFDSYLDVEFACGAASSACTTQLTSALRVAVAAPGDVTVVASGPYFAKGFSIGVARLAACASDQDCGGFAGGCDVDAGVCSSPPWEGCPTGTAACDSAKPHACVDTTSDPNNCGSCWLQCWAPHGTPGCARSQCAARACDPGYSLCNGQCLDLQRDLDHCGACDHACAGGSACNAGVCSPAPTTLLAASDVYPTLAADADAFYYARRNGAATDYGIYRTTFAGGATTAVVLAGCVPATLATNATTLFFTCGALDAIPKLGKAPWVTLATGAGGPLAVDDVNAYFGAGVFPLGGDAGVGVAPYAARYAVGQDATYVYFTDQGGLSKIAKSNLAAPPQVVSSGVKMYMSGPNPNDQTFSVTAHEAVLAIDGAVVLVPLDGSAPKTLFAPADADFQGAGQPALTATDAYATDERGRTVWRIPLSGAAPTAIGTSYGHPIATSHGILWVDGSGVRSYAP